ncbi:three-Cys-motif partner protein TcmP [Actinopolymorpha sp. B9G3]|uniref:three-Cys-motif partner protein TcmP n=1 Tax=Actinopolymorpha sp. B9G3 TaxID=3158970 RepID=UPI0032D9188D
MYPHTRAKHDLLVRYLGGWFPVLSKYRGRILFFDGFAGPDIYENGDPGSPTKALNTLLEHRFKMSDCEFVFVFNEQDPDRFESLRERHKALTDSVGELPKNVTVHFLNENFVDVAEGILEQLERNGKQLAPTFAFLDPFGYKDIPIKLIQRFLAFERCELFIYFDFNSTMRFATAGNVDKRFEELFGTDEFKNAPPSGDPQRGPFLRDLYERQLKEVCQFPYVQSFEMVRPDNKVGHYLYFCTRNIKGLEVMKEAMWKVAPGGDFRFSDVLAGQPILFEENPDTSPLQANLLSHFAGRLVNIKEVQDYTLVYTPFALSHLKARTLAPMQREGMISSPNQQKKNTFPDGTLIQFR